MRLLPMGPHAVLVEDPADPPAVWAERLVRSAPAGVVDVVPAARTVLIRCLDDEALRRLTEHLKDLAPGPNADEQPDRVAETTVTIDVVYDGEDLLAVAAAAGIEVGDIIELHAGATYQVAFCGFAPGFGYLTGLPRALHLPRRNSPRTRVPAGSVAIAAEYSAVYPRSSPGGWHLLGRTEHVLFDVERNPPATLRPGVGVRFRRLG
jgi:KipI family sensor histidine kinase inhibitor